MEVGFIFLFGKENNENCLMIQMIVFIYLYF